MNIVMQLMKQNDSLFGEVSIFVYGDCCQGNNLGTDNFQSTTVKIYNLQSIADWVIVQDRRAKEADELLEPRHVAESSQQRTHRLYRENCSFMTGGKKMMQK